MGKYTEKIKQILICLLLCSSVYLLMNIIRSNVFVEVQEEFSATVLPDKITFVDYNLTDDGYVSYGSDPQMYLPTPSEVINGIIVYFKEPTQNITACKLYYASSGEFLSEERSTGYTSVVEDKEGIREIFIEIPKGEYEVFRLDLEGVFSLDNIEFLRGDTSWITERYVSIPILIMVIICVVILGWILVHERILSSLWEELKLLKLEIVCKICHITFWLIYLLYVCFFAEISSLILYLVPIVLLGISIFGSTYDNRIYDGKVYLLAELVISILTYKRLLSLGVERNTNAIRVAWSLEYSSLVPFICITLFCLLALIYVYKAQNNLVKKIIEGLFFDEKISQISEKYNVRYFTVLAIVFGVILIYIIPPTTVPDEDYHYASLFRISRGHFFVEVQNEKVGSYYTEAELNYITKSMQDYVQGDEVYSYEKVLLSENDTSSKQMATFHENTRTAGNPIPYLWAAAGVVIVRNLIGEMNPYTTVLVARISNLLFYALIVSIAIKKTPILKNTLFLLALMPMTIYQCTSVSYDAALIPCSFLLFAYMTKIVFSDETYVLKGMDIFAVAFSCFFVFGTKIAYAPLIVCFLAVSIKKFGGVKKYICCIGLIAIIGIVAYVIPNYIHSNIVGEYIDNSYMNEQKEFLFSNVNLIPQILKNTVEEMKLLYVDEFVGYFGWFDTKIPGPFVWLFCCAFSICILIEIQIINNMCIKFNFLAVISSMICVIGTMLAMYIQHNSAVGILKGTIAYGFQGRYLIPTALFGIMGISNNLFYKFKYKNIVLKWNQNMVQITALAYLLLTVVVLYGRYWL